MADRQAGSQETRRDLPLKTPRRVIGAAFFVVAAGIASAHAADPVCGPRREPIEIPEALFLGDDIPFMGQNVTQEAKAALRVSKDPSCGREDLYFREVAFDGSFEALRNEYLGWLERQLTGPDPLTSAYVRNHGVKIVDQPGEFRFIDSVKAEPDHQGRLEIHLTEERGEKGRACRQVILRYSYLVGAPCGRQSP